MVMGEKTEDAVAREYDRLAARYDERWAFYVQATIRETLGRMDLRPGDRILDVACGTGALLQAIRHADPEARLSGTDLSAEMLAVARRRLGATADLRPGRADALPFDDGAFDVVVSTNAFHFFPRPEAALREMWRVLRPGGRLVVTDWCDDFLACRMCDLLLRLVGRAHRRIYGSAGCRRLVEAAGFEAVSVDRYKIDWLWGMMTARTTRPAG